MRKSKRNHVLHTRFQKIETQLAKVRHKEHILLQSTSVLLVTINSIKYHADESRAKNVV